MGNKTLKITVQYSLTKITITQPPLESFETFKDHIKGQLAIPKSFPIVIENNKSYISTNYKWENFTKSKILDIHIWPQIEQSVESDIVSSTFVPYLFKLQKKKSGKILSLGLCISKKLCIIPSLDLDKEELESLYKCKLVFFNEEEIDLGLASRFFLLGDQKPTQNFILIKHSHLLSDLNISVPERTEKIRGKLIFFNRKTKMLSSINTPYQQVPKYSSFCIQTEPQSFLPGAIFISSSLELIAIGRSKNSKIFYPSSLIYSEISEHFPRRSNKRIRKLLSKVRGVSLDT